MHRADTFAMKDVATARWNRCRKCDQDTPQSLVLLDESGDFADYSCMDCGTTVRTFSPPRVRAQAEPRLLTTV